MDGYLGEHSSELNAFTSFYKQAVEHIHSVMPTVKTGTIITFNSLIGDINILNTLLPISDFICYTYYPTNLSNANWEMRQPGDVFKDINLMAEKAGNKPFAFAEIGYASSADNNSSETLQQAFVKNMFAALQPYKNSKRLAFIFYHGLYDYPPGFCEQYAQSQDIDAQYLCSFMNSLGLKDYASGKTKKAYTEFFDDLQSW